MEKKGLKSGLKSGGVLSETEKEVLELFSKGYTIKQMSKLRKTSVQAVYKIRKKLLNMGKLSRLNKVENFQPTFKPSKFPIRLHGQEFNIQLLHKGQRFKSNLVISIDSNTIRTYNNSVEVYSQKSFYADDVQKASVKSMEYFNKLFYRLENDLDVIIMKPRSQNICLVNQHFAEVNNELAKESERVGDKLRVYTNDDGKLWFVVDHSLNCNEAETLHPSTSKQDMAEVIKPFFNDLRDNRPPTLSQIMGVINEIVKTNQETAAGLNVIAKLYQPQELNDGKNKELVDYFG